MIILENLTEMLKGVLEGCVLEIISRKETYGYKIVRKLNALGFTDVVEGTVYTILVRLEKKEYVNVEKKASDKGPTRKYYTLSEKGGQELCDFWGKWSQISEIMKVIKGD